MEEREWHKVDLSKYTSGHGGWSIIVGGVMLSRLLKGSSLKDLRFDISTQEGDVLEGCELLEHVTHKEGYTEEGPDIGRGGHYSIEHREFRGKKGPAVVIFPKEGPWHTVRLSEQCSPSAAKIWEENDARLRARLQEIERLIRELIPTGSIELEKSLRAAKREADENGRSVRGLKDALKYGGRAETTARLQEMLHTHEQEQTRLAGELERLRRAKEGIKVSEALDKRLRTLYEEYQEISGTSWFTLDFYFGFWEGCTRVA